MFPYISVAAEPPRPQPVSVHVCPQCGGPLFELRGQNRCSRCYFIICENCEGLRVEPVECGAAS